MQNNQILWYQSVVNKLKLNVFDSLRSHKDWMLKSPKYIGQKVKEMNNMAILEQTFKNTLHFLVLNKTQKEYIIKLWIVEANCISISQNSFLKQPRFASDQLQYNCEMIRLQLTGNLVIDKTHAVFLNIIERLINSMTEQAFTEPDEVLQLSRQSQIKFKKNYDQLLAGVNRIRYIKTKQMRNQIKMMQYLSGLSKKLQRGRVNHYQSESQFNNAFTAPMLSARKSIQPKKIRTPFTNRVNFEDVQSPRADIEPQKILHYNLQDKYKKGCIESKTTQALTNSSMIADMSLRSNKQKSVQLLLRKKNENYKEMRQLRLKNQERQQQRQRALLNAARIRRQVVRTSCQKGQNKIHQQYFEHLQLIKQVKAGEKQSRMRLEQRKYQQLAELKKIQKEELQKYEHSLIMKSNLKEIIQISSREKNKKRNVKNSKDLFQ